MSKDTIAANLQKLLKFHGNLSISDLARGTQIPQPTLHHIFEGKTKNPRRQALDALANYFSISISQLTGVIPFSSMLSDTIKNSLKISTVPLISWNDAKTWSKNKNNFSKFDEIILNDQVNKGVFCLQLFDSSMEPLFQEKSILIFDPSKVSKERDFVLVYFAQYDLLIFNRLFIDGGKFYVKQDKKNGDANLMKLNEEDKIIATLIEARIQF